MGVRLSVCSRPDLLLCSDVPSLPTREGRRGLTWEELIQTVRTFIERHLWTGRFIPSTSVQEKADCLWHLTPGPERAELRPIFKFFVCGHNPGLAEDFLTDAGFETSKKAIALYRRVLAIHEETCGEDGPEVIPVLDQLATALSKEVGHLEEAMSLFKRARDILKNCDPPPREGESLRDIRYKIASLFHSQGLSEKSLAKHRKMRKENPNSEWVSKLLMGEANVLRDLGHFSKAMSLFNQALKIREQFGKDSPQVAHVLANIAALYYDQGRFSDAREQYHKTLEILNKETEVEMKSEEVATILCNLAAVNREEGHYSTATELYEKDRKSVV